MLKLFKEYGKTWHKLNLGFVFLKKTTVRKRRKCPSPDLTFVVSQSKSEKSD